ncbi:MAG TPA: exodeoxyribonuclease VII large subunit [Thermoanaerobaculia bacterium]|nr:exodeoxyribonuclease VII large subunit [Thermoanaerobaculia bacterium]
MSEPRQGELGFAAPVYTVSQLVAEVSNALSSRWRRVAVAGQACEVRRYASGHVYFALKDASAKIPAVLWRTEAARLPFTLEEGMEVVATGTLCLYAARGQFQMQVLTLQPVGVGAMQLAFEQLKRRLAAEGLFDPARKRALPFLPKRVGIVTSPQGAALRDILNVLRRRHRDLRLTVFPARVQGEGAVSQVIEGLRALARLGCDVVILARGGGSAEDLAAFNDERLARAIAASPVPTISAVGHETDWTIADHVADLRAPTPSAAAEVVVGAKEEISRRVGQARRGLAHLARRRLAEARGRVGQAARAETLVRFRYALMRRRDRFEAARGAVLEIVESLPRILGERLSRAAEGLSAVRRILQLGARREGVRRLDAALRAAGRGKVAASRARFGAAAGRLRALDPLAILSRGYAVVYPEGSGVALTDAARTAPGDRLRIRLARGGLDATVTARREEKGRER